MGLVALTALVCPHTHAADSTPAAGTAPAVTAGSATLGPVATQGMSAAEDRQRMMDLLHLSEPGPLPPLAEDTNRPPNTLPAGRGSNYTDDQGNTYVRSGWGHWSNYDENKGNPYRVPNPLLLRNGQPVKDAEAWWTQRRPEILNDFLTEVYG
jgi:hypothetical protein